MCHTENRFNFMHNTWGEKINCDRQDTKCENQEAQGDCENLNEKEQCQGSKNTDSKGLKAVKPTSTIRKTAIQQKK